jgi:acyl-CoA synthetase (NDP forming)
MRAKITVNSNEVTVERDDPVSGERTTTCYYAPYRGGHVRILVPFGRESPTACEALYERGLPLTATVETLPAVIRRELRRRNAIERRMVTL